MNGDRSPARDAGPRGVLRHFRRDRLTGQLAAGLVGVLCVGALVYGVGTASAKYRLADVGAWLSAGAKGLVVHANGLAGKVDGKAAVVPQMRGHHIRIVQDGTTVLLVDTDTGVVSRIDPSQLKITGSRAAGGPGLQVLAGSGAAYTIDSVKGVVQRIDPLTLAPAGPAATLTAPLGQAGIDGKGGLWVPVPQSGQVVPFQDGRQGTPVTAGRGGDRLALTIAAGTPVVVDSTSATALVVRPDGTQRITLPAPVSKAANGVRMPPVADGQVVPMLGAGGSLYLLDTGVGRVESVALRVPHHAFEAPNVLGPRVYLPDRTAGHLLVFNTDKGAWEAPIPATRPGGTIEVVTRDHMLWVNDPDGALALALDPNGAVKRIKKYDDHVPGGNRRPIPIKARPGDGNGNRNTGGGPGHGGNDPVPPAGRPPRPPAKQDPTAPDPPTPIASGDNGSIEVRFTPAVQPQGVYPVSRFVLLGADDRLVKGATPAQFPGNAPGGTFTVGGLACGSRTYEYKVAAEYKGKNGKTAYSPSGTVGATACRAPGPPTTLRATGVNHGATVTWAKSSGYDVTYNVTWQGGSTSTKGTSANVSGLTNGTTSHTISVTAHNGAGDSTPVSISVTLDPNQHTVVYNGHNNNSTTTVLHSGVGKNAPRDGTFPKGFTGQVTVICQQQSDSVTDTDDPSLKSDIWDKINYGGRVRWVSDLYVATPNSNAGTFSSPKVWGCS
ncbi:fibronectin type III domain-containing protein [Actinomadura verrucosospora]|uniref:Fibronectin type III domain-containing protein n=1 Tax=Actinomadura verrucosospora TaxID=46165 RepID=A0A7D3ZIQ2_ACTVE|nr:fibronectin type III domain-containing protein [Actinomadura verrucosospora]QKG20621.1 fibronectin type III domain-containing protein [Actinomadura verrucosospora]